METVDCNLCSSKAYKAIYSRPDRYYFKDEFFTVVECVNCGLGFVNPRPTYAEMSRYYPPSYYEYFDNNPDYHLHRYTAEAELIQKEAIHNKKKLLLDIGCANGDFPRYMKNLGWEVEGVEISSNSKSISDFKIYNQEFTQVPSSGQNYDVITAWEVLEHTHDPMAYFKKASTLLKSGGLFIFSVTNFNSISSKYLFMEDVPRHLYFFTNETIKQYLAHAGLVLRTADYSDKIHDYRPYNWLRYYVYLFFKRRKLEWKDIPEYRLQYLERLGLSNNLISNLQYVVHHPFASIDRLLMPIFEKYQIMSKSYGSATYIASKP